MPTEDTQQQPTRSVYRHRPPRLQAGLLTAAVVSLPALLLLTAWQAAPVQAVAVTSLSVFDVAAPAEPAPSEPPPPEPSTSASPPATEQAAVAPAATTASPAAVPAPVVAFAAPAAAAQSIAPAVPPPAPAHLPTAAAAAAPGPVDWQSRVLGRLNAVKRYPSSARARRQQGVALIRFSVDRSGAVGDVVLARSSGFALLDREALALPRRAAPLPPPPEDMMEAAANLVVPVDFTVG
jgi:protein TonB